MSEITELPVGIRWEQEVFQCPQQRWKASGPRVPVLPIMPSRFYIIIKSEKAVREKQGARRRPKKDTNRKVFFWHVVHRQTQIRAAHDDVISYKRQMLL